MKKERLLGLVFILLPLIFYLLIPLPFEYSEIFFYLYLSLLIFCLMLPVLIGLPFIILGDGKRLNKIISINLKYLIATMIISTILNIFFLLAKNNYAIIPSFILTFLFGVVISSIQIKRHLKKRFISDIIVNILIYLGVLILFLVLWGATMLMIGTPLC